MNLKLATNITNAELWDAARAKSPQFRSITSKATADMFTERGWERLSQIDNSIFNDFYGLSLRVYLQVVNVSRAVDRLAASGFGENQSNPMGGYIQRMSINSVKPVSPAYKNLKDGDTVDPWIVRKPSTQERFFQQNFDYQSLLTIPDAFQCKQIFINENGMATFMAGLMESLENGYINQVYVNKLECINAAINSTKNPLQDTQKYDFVLDNPMTTEQKEDFIITVNNVVDAMTMYPQTNAFNAYKFTSSQDVSRLKLLIRPGFMNDLRTKTRVGAFNPEDLNFKVDVIEVPHFGGLEPYKEKEYTTKLYPVYDKTGVEIGFSSTENSDTVEVEENDVQWKDPNENVYAILADIGSIFVSLQNGYSVEGIRNPRALYTNYWASSMNNTIAYDPLYNFVVFNKTTSTDKKK